MERSTTPPGLPVRLEELEDKKYGNISGWKKQQLIEHLTKDFGLKTDADMKRTKLQALCALARQGIIGQGSTPEPVMLATVTEWVEMRVGELVAQLESQGLDTSGHRWDHIEVLITAKSVPHFS